jgi:dihydroorotase
MIPTCFLAAVTKGEQGEFLTSMTGLSDAGALGFSDDGKPVVSAGMLRKALQYQHVAGGVIALHEEDPALSSDGVMHEGAVSARLGVSGIPSVSESTMIARDAALAAYEDATVHFQHISAALSVQALAAARENGVRATGEATPHHLLLTDEAVLGLDTNFKMNPPLRAERDRQAVIEGLRSGVIDCIATDHAPHALQEKEVAFEEAPMGTTGLETAFAAIYSELVVPGVLPLALLVERITAGCAVFGLPQPRIESGAEANLVLVDLERSFVVGESGYVSRAANCCFDGRSFRGQIELTVAAGQVAYAAAGVLDAAPAEVR